MLADWCYRTIGLHDFATHRMISPAFGPTGDHRMDGILVASGPVIRSGGQPLDAALLDIAPTVLHLLGVPAPGDMDGRVLTELFGQTVPRPHLPSLSPAYSSASSDRTAAVLAESGYSAKDDAAVQQRLADLGYL